MKVAITGATGSVGRILTRHLLDHPSLEQIVAIGHSEDRVLRYEGEFGFDGRIETRKGDVLDERFLRRVIKDVDAVYHLAAMKHVHLSERDPYQVSRVNVEGSMKVLEAVLEDRTPKCVLMSTDKVVNSTSLYGATKFVSERLFLSEAVRNNGVDISVLRSGNIFVSTGNVLEVWLRTLRTNNEIRVTDPEMTRFFIEEERLGDLLLSMRKAPSGHIVIPKLRAYRLADLAEIFLDRFGDSDTSVVEIGKRPGEKVHEVLLAEDELDRTREHEETYEVHPEPVDRPIDKLPRADDHLVSRDELEEILDRQLDQLTEDA